jgi:phosphate starvation-inducible protein PhoH and related proteins
MASKTLNFDSARFLSQLYCNDDKNLEKVEKALSVKIITRDDWLTIEGKEADIDKTAHFFELLTQGRSQGINFLTKEFENALSKVVKNEINDLEELLKNPLVLRIKNKTMVPKTINQKRYISCIQKHDIVFGIGPAGTGKTYLAVAAALHALIEEKSIKKIIISRPAVEAGEALGFLPGDLTEKIEPYLRPLYDAMHDLIGPEDSMKLLEKKVVEIAPLAYMRGRTLSDSYIILDEAQNTTPQQMMMILTRLGENSRMIITGDVTQVDLPRSKDSGLRQAIQILRHIDDIKLFYFDHTDVVRHPLVAKIIKAYEDFNRVEKRN